MSDSKTSDDQQQVAQEFTSYYLQRVTKEFAEDLDKVRVADDFTKNTESSIALLVSALQQGTALFSPEQQRGVVRSGAASRKEE